MAQGKSKAGGASRRPPQKNRKATTKTKGQGAKRKGGAAAGMH